MDDIDDEDDELDTKDEDGIVKDDPQFTLAITRGIVINFGDPLFNFSLEMRRIPGKCKNILQKKLCFHTFYNLL